MKKKGFWASISAVLVAVATWFGTHHGGTTPPVTPGTTTTTIPPVAGQYVSQWPNAEIANIHEEADNGKEISGVTFDGVDVRFLANDSQHSGYNVKIPNNVVTFQRTADGSVQVTAVDYIGPSGTRFRWVGFRVAKATNPMLTANPLLVSREAWQKTFRVYWQTVR